MGEIIYLDEYLIKEDIRKVEDAINEARTLRSMGHDIPGEVFEDLESLQELLNFKLTAMITGASGSL
tara:strand:- start:2074 stop:2274 length:201 start_codon:yes stop_codon:yes gene_type:complete